MNFQDCYAIIKEKFDRKDISVINTDFTGIIHFTGEDGGYIFASYIDGKKFIEPLQHDNANISVSLSVDTFEKIIHQEMDPFRAFTTGKIKAQGNVFLALSLYKKFKSAGQ